jgi:hypothetical protein
MGFTMEASGIPVGSYRVRFETWETSVHDQYGDRVRFVFTVIGGEHNDAETSRFTSAKMTLKSAMGKIASGLAGHKLDLGEDFDPADYVGKEYLAIVEETESGSTRVGSVLPVGD